LEDYKELPNDYGYRIGDTARIVDMREVKKEKEN